MDNFYLPLTGGILIGIAVSLMLYLNGRVTGISGILYGATVSAKKGDRAWRWYFIAGLLLGGLLLKLLKPEAFSGSLPTPNSTVAVAGLLVGFGTVWGGGCTSGYGICGVSRLSVRAIVATITFILAGILAIVIFRKLGLFL